MPAPSHRRVPRHGRHRPELKHRTGASSSASQRRRFLSRSAPGHAVAHQRWRTDRTQGLRGVQPRCPRRRSWSGDGAGHQRHHDRRNQRLLDTVLACWKRPNDDSRTCRAGRRDGAVAAQASRGYAHRSDVAVRSVGSCPVRRRGLTAASDRGSGRQLRPVSPRRA